MSDKTISIYGCGGCGISIASAMESLRRNTTGVSKVLPALDIVYVDTSESDLTDAIPAEHFFKITPQSGIDGSGSVRSENYEEIRDSVLAVLQHQKPGDLSIVISSASGGSGSVIAPSIVSELQKQGKPTIVFTVGSYDSRLAIENTVKTLQSYAKISEVTGRPVAAVYAENSPTKKKSEVNNMFAATIRLLGVLFSGKIRNLDTADLHNWLNFPKVTSYKSSLALLTCTTEKVQPTKGSSIAAVATIVRHKDDDMAVGQTVDYHTGGYVSEELLSSFDTEDKAPLPAHFVLSVNALEETYLRIANQLKELDNANNSRVLRSAILHGNENSNSDGLIL